MRALISILLLCLPLWGFNFDKSALKLTKGEQEVLKRELIELDINIRTQASLIAQGDIFSLQQSLAKTSTFSTVESPRHRASFGSLKLKLVSKGLFGFFGQIQATSKSLRNYINTQAKLRRSIDWARVQQQYRVILANTRGFYLKAGIK